MLSWGPTSAELDEARALVAGWDAEQLAGQVIVGRYHGTDPEEAGRLVQELHLAGMSVTGENVVDAEQVRATTQAIADAVAADGRAFPAVIGVDQEGGTVAHLDGIATTFPSFATAGRAVAAGGREGRRAVRDASEALGLELRSFGFTWVFAPVADVTVPGTDVTIGSRSPSEDPRTASRAVVAALRGYDDAALVSTVKHFPGHGSVSADSHTDLPVLTTPLDELARTDLRPFDAAVRSGAPAVMVGHLDVQDLAPGVPATLAPEAYEWLRDDLGFEGVAITDSLGMGAVADQGMPAVRALAAGADLLLMPVDPRETHRLVTAAITDGTVPRERAEEAAARVVAMQLWQQRRADEAPLPDDPAALAAEAAAELVAQGY